MNKTIVSAYATLAVLALNGATRGLADEPPSVPRFSVTNMDTTVSPKVDFYHYACGTWLKDNPVPADKSRWAGFDELQQRNWKLIKGILEKAEQDQSGPEHSPEREAGDFFAAAMDTNTINSLGLKPLEGDFAKIAAVNSTSDLLRVAAEFQMRGVGSFFDMGASPDEKNSDIYSLHFGQGGLGLPDRDYYLTDGFAKQRAGYVVHIKKMFVLAGDSETNAQAEANTILDLETAMAKASKSRTDLRDPVENYHKFTFAEMAANYPDLDFKGFLAASGVEPPEDVVIGQPEFFTALDQMVKDRPLNDWKTYLRWHTMHGAAAFLEQPVEEESFAFYGTMLSGQPKEEPRWQRSARRVDRSIGEALGQLFVEQYFPPSARARMNELIGNLKSVLHDRLEKLPWMTQATREKALAKFAAFTQKIGYPDKFRDYSSIEIRRDDYLGNVQRADLFESKRELARLGKPVDKTEWGMTPQTVNAYFNPSENEIVFPAGILQPPFFDVTADDAVNYGAIGVVIGHEMTHCYDDQGRKYDEKGNLNDWWTADDAKAFDARAQKLVDQYNGYEALPGVHVNGRLTLGENIADLGGTTISYEALQRALAKDPSQRKTIDGFTPEQRFFLSFGQVWRTNWREAALRRGLTIDPHSPGQFRAIGPLVNMQEFYEAFDIKAGDPMWRAPELRAIIW
jgi:putative endopeptidase